MFKSIISSLSVFGQLLRSDILVFKPFYKDRLIDFFIYVSISVVVMGHLLTKLGLRADFGLFTAATSVAVAGMFEIFPRAMVLVADITGNKVISYDITLPLPAWMAIARIGFSDAIRSFSLSIFTLPFGLPFVWSQFNSAAFSPVWFVAFIVINALFFSYFGMFLASQVSNINNLESMWVRVIFPLWTLGAFQFTWQTLHDVSPAWAYVALLNPFIYPMEGVRAAVMGQAGSLPMWVCFVATCGFTLLCAVISIRSVLKRLDAV